MRFLLLLTAPALLAAAVAGTVLGDDEALTFRSFDVTSILTRHDASVGPTLGTRPPYFTADEWQEIEPLGVGPEELVELVRNAVDPSSWEVTEGCFLEIHERHLHVRHRPDVVRKVDRFLYGLAARTSARALVQVTATEDGAVRDAASLELPLDVTRFVEATNRIRFVTDYEVEIAQASNIANPVIDFAAEGLVAQVLVRPLVDGERLLVEAVLQRGRFGENRQLELQVDEECFNQPYRSTDQRPIGTIDLPVFEQTSVQVTALARSGETVELPVVVGERRVTLSVRTERLGPPAGGPIVDVAALTSAPLPFVFRDRTHHDYRRADELRLAAPRLRLWEPEERPLAHVDVLVEMVRSLVAPDYWNVTGDLAFLSNGHVFVHGDPAMQGRVRDFLVEQEKHAIRPVVLDLLVYSVPASDPSENPTWRPGAGGFPSDEGAELLSSARLPTISGRRASVLAGRTAHYVADYDNEVAQESRIADPIPAQSFEGLVGSVRPALVMGDATIAVDLDLTLARSEIDEQPFDTGARFLGPIDRVQEHRFVFRSTVHVPTNGAYVIDTGPDPDDENRRRIVVLKAAQP